MASLPGRSDSGTTLVTAGIKNRAVLPAMSSQAAGRARQIPARAVPQGDPYENAAGQAPCAPEVSRKTRLVKIPAPVRHTGHPHSPSRRALAARALGTDTNLEHRHAADTKLELRHEIRIPALARRETPPRLVVRCFHPWRSTSFRVRTAFASDRLVILTMRPRGGVVGRCR